MAYPEQPITSAFCHFQLAARGAARPSSSSDGLTAERLAFLWAGWPGNGGQCATAAVAFTAMWGF